VQYILSISPIIYTLECCRPFANKLNEIQKLRCQAPPQPTASQTPVSHPTAASSHNCPHPFPLPIKPDRCAHIRPVTEKTMSTPSPPPSSYTTMAFFRVPDLFYRALFRCDTPIDLMATPVRLRHRLRSSAPGRSQFQRSDALTLTPRLPPSIMQHNPCSLYT
jgi:hypothetical protein